MTLLPKLDTIEFKNQTKNWRKQQDWYKGGKYNECEKIKFNLIKKNMSNM